MQEQTTTDEAKSRNRFHAEADTVEYYRSRMHIHGM